MSEKKVRIKSEGRYYDAVLDDLGFVTPMWNTFKRGDIIVTENETRKWSNVHIIHHIEGNYAYVYASTLGKVVVYSFDGECRSLVNSPHVRLATKKERDFIFGLLREKEIEWDSQEMKLIDVSKKDEEEWKVTIDDKQLLFDSQHNETIEYSVRLHNFNAYDDKGNKIQGDCVRFVKKEYDKR